MASMSSTISALQAHNKLLQDYLSEWSRQQQRLLEIMPVSPASPRTPRSHARVTHFASDELAVKAPISTDEGETAAVAGAAIGETAGNPASGSGSDTHCNWSSGSKPEKAGALTDAAMKKTEGSDHSDAPNLNVNLGALSPVEICRRELSNQLQVSLNRLKGLHRRQEIVAWMNETLTNLEDEMINFDMLDIPEQAKPVEDSFTLLPLSAHVSYKASKSIHTGPCRKSQDLVAAVVHSKGFESLTAAVIVYNAIIMGVSTDQMMMNLEASESSFVKHMENLFFTYYSVEVGLRLLGTGLDFFIGEDKYWNWFDLGLVLISTNDHLEPLYNPEGEGASPAINVSFLRLVRLFKLVKLFRMIRLMKMFKQLRVMLGSIADSLPAVLWAGLLVLVINYVVSILFVSLCTSCLKDAAKQNFNISSDTRQGIETYWSSVFAGMHSLLGATTGGDDWFAIGAPLREVGWGCYALFIIYMGFFLIVILNTVASLFVAVVFDNHANDSVSLIAAELEKKEEIIEELQEFYNQIDDDGNGLITFEEFSRHAHDPRFQAWASHLEIDISDAHEFFEVLSSSGAKPVDIESFVVGCIKLKGNARSVDMMAMFHQTKQMHKTIGENSLMLHMKKRRDASVANEMKEMLNTMCRYQTEILARTSQWALANEESSRFDL